MGRNVIREIVDAENQAIEPMINCIHVVNIATGNTVNAKVNIREVAKKLVKDQFAISVVTGKALEDKKKQLDAKSNLTEEVKANIIRKYNKDNINYVSRRILSAQGLLQPAPVVDNAPLDMAVIKGKLNKLINDFNSEYAIDADEAKSTTQADEVYITEAELRNYASLNCAKPVRTKLPDGRYIWNRCGKCVACLASRRMEWSKRLNDEREHPQCLHAFGFTLTYDKEHLPYLSLETLVRGNYDWEAPNSSHTYLNVLRGCSTESLKLQDNIGLLNNRDIDLYLKKVREKFEVNYFERTGKNKRKKPIIFVRYFIVGEYGAVDDLNKVSVREARTGRPHYHGIFYIFAKNQKIADEFKSNRFELLALQTKAEQWTLDCWEHCKQTWDSKKEIYVGKSIQMFGDGWGNYLGKYLNKNVLAGFKGCIGSLFVPEKMWCSRSNHSIGLGPIGISTFFYNKTLMRKFLQELDQCVKSGERWNPTYIENDYEKSLPKAYRRFVLERYFGVTMSMVARYIQADNIIRDQKLNQLNKDYSITKSVFDDNYSLIPFGPNYNAIYSAIQEYTYDGLGDDTMQYFRILTKFRKYSISSAPLFAPEEFFGSSPLKVEYKLPVFSSDQVARIKSFIRFRDQQTASYMDSLCTWQYDSEGNPFTISDKRVVAKIVGAYSRVAPILDLNVLPKGHKVRVKSFQTSEHVELVGKRYERVLKIKEVTRKAIEYKQNHEYKNGYVRVKDDSSIVIKD